jgi:HlyD family secretion protein
MPPPVRPGAFLAFQQGAAPLEVFRMQNKPSPLPRVVILLALLAGAAWLVLRSHDDSDVVSGTIETDEVHVASRYGGRVEKIHAWDGDALKAGDVIVEMEANELVARRQLAAAQLDEMVKGPREQEIKTALGEWQAQQAELEFARLDAKRMEELFTTKAVSKTDHDRAVTRANALDKSTGAARQRFELLREGTRPERIAQARAALAEIDAHLREMTIRAPGDCILEVLGVRVGDVLAPNREVATLVLPQRLWARVYVPENWLGHIRLGQEVALRVDSFPDREFKGVVEQINRAAEFTPRNVQTVGDRIRQVFGVKLRIDAAQKELRPGMAVDARFPGVPAKPR